MRDLQGLLLIDKSIGWTSFDVVAKVRGAIKQSGVAKPKVGHTGTLDPLATGLLVLVVGSYTKRAGEFSKLDKTYEVTMRLGQSSSTGDDEGDKTVVSSREPSQNELENAIKSFEGEIMQTPPQFSAIKVNGQRAYKLARAGKTVTLEPRKVTVHILQINEYKYPEVKFTADVSSGTYIRSLVEDIGAKLETGAYMSDLCRTRVGQFELNKAIAIQDLKVDSIAQQLIE